MNIIDAYNIIIMMYITMGHFVLEVFEVKTRKTTQAFYCILGATGFYIFAALCWMVSR